MSAAHGNALSWVLSIQDFGSKSQKTRWKLDGSLSPPQPHQTSKHAHPPVNFCSFPHGLYTFVEHQDCGYTSEHSEDLPSWSPTVELGNTPTATRPQIRHLSTIFGSSLLLLCILTVPPTDSYCDPNSYTLPLLHPHPWPTPNNGLVLGQVQASMSPSWHQSLA